MVIAMRVWDIAKILISECDSPEDVDRILHVLDDPAEYRDLRSLLIPFSSENLDSPLQEPEGRQTQGEASRSLPGTAKASAVKQLETLFRSDGMTNKQVERWLLENFEVSRSVGKGSLKDFLEKVLSDFNLAKVNRIIASAQRLKDTSKSESDIASYWEQQDRRHLSY